MGDQFPDFRLGTVLSTSFTATLTERRGDSVERIPTPQRLSDWLAVVGLHAGPCTDDQLERAVTLREAIHVAATTAALGETIPAPAIRVINTCSAHGQATAQLTAHRRREWTLNPDTAVDDALGVVAADAIAILAGERDGRLALCASPTCRAAFFDTSRSRSRRWCEMNTCGNKEKKARFKAQHRNDESPSPG